MIRNHLKTAFRSLTRKRFYSIINIAGLALGLTAAMFIWQYVTLEKSYDHFHKDADRIYRISTNYLTGGRQDDSDAMNSAPVGPALVAEYPEVESFVRITPEYGRTVFKYEEKQFEEQKIFYTDSNFFELFNYEILAGNQKTALMEPFSIVMTKSFAEHYFGPMASWQESPIGKTLRVNNMVNARVTAITADPPENTHFKYNALISFSTFLVTNGNPLEQWEWNDFYTYIRLNENTSQAQFEPKLKAFADRHLNSQGSDEYDVYYSMHPIRDIHLHSHLGWEMEANGDAKSVSFLLLVAIAILLIAWANYVNLATARAGERAEEVGIRKVVGANRQSLVTQFLTEAFIVNLLSVVLAMMLIVTFQPLMERLVGKSLTPLFEEPLYAVGLGTLILIFGTLLSGLYPAFVLSGFSPGKSLKSHTTRKGQDWFRKALVTFQYASSIILIIATLIIFRQLNFMKNQDLGFSIDQKIIVNAPSVYSDSVAFGKFESFKNQILQFPDIENVSASSAIPGKYYYDVDSRGGIRLQGADEDMGAAFTSFRIDEDFYDVYDLEILAGKPFTGKSNWETSSLAVNEAALPLLGLDSPEQAIGKIVRFQSDDHLMEITNVFKNYHHKSLRHKFEPTMLWDFIPDPLYYSIKFSEVNRAQTQRVVANIESTWNTIFPENPFHYFFFDDQFNDQYEADSRLGKIIATFSLFAVFIACLGLFGLTSYLITVRTKEIGIRKVLGASIQSIVVLLTKDFIRLVLLALVIAIPLAVYFGQKWLENFAYKSTLSWWIFALAGGLAILVATLTVSIQSTKAAMSNPMNALKDE